jgi:hypothetical protein
VFLEEDARLNQKFGGISLGVFSRLTELWKSKDKKRYDAEIKQDIGSLKHLEADPIYYI